MGKFKKPIAKTRSAEGTADIENTLLNLSRPDANRRPARAALTQVGRIRIDFSIPKDSEPITLLQKIRVASGSRQQYQNYSPLRSSAVSLIPFLRPNSLTTSSLAGIVRLLRGETQMPVSTFGFSSCGLPVPRSARPFRIIGE
jgi:hypothetical protein